MLKRLAPAKVNLYLHVAAPDARGYHPLRSLVAFADIGDDVRLLPVDLEGHNEAPAPRLSIDGLFSAGLGAGEDNLIMKAVRRFEQAAGVKVQDHDIALTKSLPIASGIGGGSADAGAVLHLLREVYAPAMNDESLAAIAGSIGADGVMCLWARASVAEGYGERLTPAHLPRLPAVLINPLVECSTAAVYSGFDDLGQFADIDGPGLDGDLDLDALVEGLKGPRNDLQAPAVVIQPVINDVLESLAAQPETLLARMSGSGATCFALCGSDQDASILAKRLEGIWPGAWVRACALN
jgi:4-diphosphocytidyl-2-C-methyl-D-erythritol kinase